MKLHSHMTVWRNEEPLRVRIKGTYEPAYGCYKESISGITAEDYDGEVALTEGEGSEAEQILIDEKYEH